MADNYWEITPGLNNVGSYQVSGRPFAYTGDTTASASVVSFPEVTRWVIIKNNHGSQSVKVAFSLAGLTGTEYFVLAAGAETQRLEVKISELHFVATGAGTEISITAGITNVAVKSCATAAGPSWSGSVGVG
jgi:hypothetical protein